MTKDIDWPPEEATKDTLNIFEKYEIKCTLFYTHDSEAIKKCNRDLFEIAIHPNYNKNLFQNNGDLPLKKINYLLEVFPEAREG